MPIVEADHDGRAERDAFRRLGTRVHHFSNFDPTRYQLHPALEFGASPRVGRLRRAEALHLDAERLQTCRRHIIPRARRQCVVVDRQQPGKLVVALACKCLAHTGSLGQVIGHVIEMCGQFIDEVCTECPVRCIDTPDKNLADAFYADHHPAVR